MTLFPIPEYRPDVADINSNFTDEIRNLLVADGSYIPMPSFAATSQSLPKRPLGAVALRSLDGGVAVFAGTEDKLYQLDNTDMSWHSITEKDVNYSATESAPWSFACFGNYVIAVNKNNKPQVFVLGKSQFFRDLGGNPPQAGTVKIWGDFVCLMQLPDNPNRVHWSGLNNAEFWTVGENNCDYQDFPEGGSVQGSSEATNPIIFLQNAIYFATFVPGSDITFSFQKVHDKRGVKSPRSIACRGANVFYADEGGFFQISADGAITPIGFEKVDRSVFTRLNASHISDISGAIDPFYSRVYWAVDYAGRGIFDEMVVYDWGLGKWSTVTINAAFILPIYISGYTLDGLDNVNTNLDQLGISLDSKAWQGGAPILGAFSENFSLGTFSGSPMEAAITTQELGATDGSVQRMENLLCLVDTDQVRLSIGVRFRRSERAAFVWSKECQVSNYTQRFHKRSRGRYHRFRMRIPAGVEWHHLKGFDVSFTSAGRR